MESDPRGGGLPAKRRRSAGLKAKLASGAGRRDAAAAAVAPFVGVGGVAALGGVAATNATAVAVVVNSGAPAAAAGSAVAAGEAADRRLVSAAADATPAGLPAAAVSSTSSTAATTTEAHACLRAPHAGAGAARTDGSVGRRALAASLKQRLALQFGTLGPDRPCQKAVWSVLSVLTLQTVGALACPCAGVRPAIVIIKSADTTCGATLPARQKHTALSPR